jgi:photosystem II stability/assembly factor-like uncharacterized protein
MKRHLFLFISVLTCGLVFAQWTQQSSAFSTASRGINTICIVDPNTVWATAIDGSNPNNYITEFTRTANAGANWTAGVIATGVSGAGLANISAIDANTAWACVYQPSLAAAGGIWKTTDGGAAWTKQTTAAFSATSFPDFVYFWDANNGITVGDPAGGYFEVYTTNDGGANWIRTANTTNQLSPVSSAEYAYPNGFSAAGGSLWFCTTKGRVFKTTDMGQTFSNSTVGGGLSDVSKVTFADVNLGYAGMHINGNLNYQVAITTDGGSSWSAITAGTGIMGADFCAVPGTSSLVSVGSDQTINGSTWSNDQALGWTLMEDTTISPRRLSVQFYDAVTGWSGSFNQDALTDGVYKFDGMVGIESRSFLEQLIIFPNPATDNITISLPGIKADCSISVFNLAGEKISEISASFPATEIDLSGMSPGIYILEIACSQNKTFRKFIRQ